jgi:DNA-binding protein
MEKTTTEVKKIDDKFINVRRKQPMNFVLSVITQFNGNGTKDVILKARGRSISTAADSPENVLKRFGKNTKVKNITINTRSPRNKDGENQMFHQLKYVLQQSRKPEKECNIIIA